MLYTVCPKIGELFEAGDGLHVEYKVKTDKFSRINLSLKICRFFIKLRIKFLRIVIFLAFSNKQYS